MGRWAQRTRAGGGVSVNFMLEALEEDSDSIIVTFLTPTNLAALEAGFFIAKPSDAAGDSISLLGNNQIQLDFLVGIGSDTELLFTGGVPGFLQPQTIAIN